MARARSPVNAVRQLYRHFLNSVRTEKESPTQRQQFEEFGYFDVVGCTSGRLYRIYQTSMPPNVYEMNDIGRRKRSVCFGQLVKGDIMLAQKIALETDEQSALAVANIIPA